VTQTNTQTKNGVAMGNESRVWLITGCSTGFGRALAQAVLENGDRLIATARHTEKLQDLAQSYPQQVRTLSLDVTAPDNIRSAVAEAEKAFRRIDVLVNNAGYGTMGAIEEASDEDIKRQFDTNFFGALNMTRAILPILRSQHSGHILNISSVGGMVSMAGGGIYSSTKFALEAISEALAQEVAPLGIKVTIIEPGAFRTDFSGRSLAVPSQQIEDYAQTAGQFMQWVQEVDGKQPGDPEKAAKAMIRVVESDNPPLRLALGEDAVNGIEKKLQSVQTELDQWREVAVKTAFEGVSASAIGG
jgi:NAD(P)-dependent dehydrogenase (short-subunit alcohol dehydrogenase family)